MQTPSPHRCEIPRVASRVSSIALAALLCIAACSDNGTNTNPTQTTGGSTATPTSTGGTPAAAAGTGATTATTTGAAGTGMTTTTPAAGSTGTTSTPKAGMDGSATAGSGTPAAGSGTAAAGMGGSMSAAAGSSGAPSAAGSGSMATAGSGSSAPGGACTREALRGAVDDFYAALAAHTTDKLKLATNVKYTENAKTLMPGEGVWKTAGMVKFKRTAADTMTCQTATESVIPDGSTDRVYGLRLKLDAEGKISEIEGILVTDYILIMPAGLVNSKSDDWETVLPADKQMPRDQMQKVMDKYLKEFPSGACGFADSCTRLEDGGSVGKCVDGSLVTCNMMDRPNSNVLKPLNHVIDLECGIVVGFTIFLGGYDDFHLFKMRDGKVASVHAVLTQTNNKTGWE